MSETVEWIFSAEVLAIVIPAIIFIITVILVVKRLASFVMTLLFLTFALVSGLAIVNHDVVRSYLKGEYSKEQVDSWQNDVAEDLQKLWESMKDLKDQLIKQEAEQQPAESAWIEKVENRIDSLEEIISETRAAIDHRPSRDSGSVAESAPVETDTQAVH